MHLQIHDLIYVLLRISLGCMFTISGLRKASQILRFIHTVDSYQLLPSFISKPVAFLIISIEIAVGLLLLIGWETKSASLISILIILCFITAMAIVLIRKQSVECGCFGEKHYRSVSYKNIIIDIFLLTALLLIFMGAIDALSIDSLHVATQDAIQRAILEWVLPVFLVGVGITLIRNLVWQLREIVSFLPFKENTQ
jgi:uncharacterized membrane protein YphA (DoxX/SURF4 family)